MEGSGSSPIAVLLPLKNHNRVTVQIKPQPESLEQNQAFEPRPVFEQREKKMIAA